jgi:hypothetical protein
MPSQNVTPSGHSLASSLDRKVCLSSLIPFQKNPFCRFLNDVKGGQCRMFFSKGIFLGGFPDSPTVFISAAKSSLTKHFNNSRQASDVQISLVRRLFCLRIPGSGGNGIRRKKVG